MPANTIARLVPDQRAAGAEPVTARATLRRPNHPRAVGAADQIADCGHASIIAIRRTSPRQHRPDGRRCLWPSEPIGFGAYRTQRVPDHLADELPEVREQRGQRGRRGRGPTAYEAICLTSGMSSASTGIICSVRSVCASHTTHCRPNVTFRIGWSGNNLWKQSKQIF